MVFSISSARARSCCTVEEEGLSWVRRRARFYYKTDAGLVGLPLWEGLYYTCLVAAPVHGVLFQPAKLVTVRADH